MTNDDFEIEPGLTAGEWLHAQIADQFIIETEGWAPARVARIVERFRASRPGRRELTVVVPWIPAFLAFTAPGRYVYFCRRLLERLPEDEAAAFVIAHEVAHHDLGHTRIFPDWAAGFARRRSAAVIAALWPGIERRLYGPERETDADRYAVELCYAAGYDVERCLDFFRIMVGISLDLGDRDIVFGPDPESDQELAPDASALTKARIWTWQRLRGYLPLTDREAHARLHYAALVAGQVDCRPSVTT